MQYKTNEVESLDAMRNLPLAVRTPDGPKNIPLSNLAKIRRVNIPGEIAHYNISRVYDVLVNVENRDVGSVADDVEKAVGTLDPPDGVNTTLRGPVVTMKKGTAVIGGGSLLQHCSFISSCSLSFGRSSIRSLLCWQFRWG